MTRLLGVLLMVLALYLVLLASNENARTLNTQGDIADRLGFYGILTVGVAVLIISGGFDLSIGSVVGLGRRCFYGLLLQGHNRQVTMLITGVPLAGLALFSIVYIVRIAERLFLLLLSRNFNWWLAGLIVVAGGIFVTQIVLAVLLTVWIVCSTGIQQLLGSLNPCLAMLFVLAGSSVLGLYHGLLVTKLRLQPFLVTLCGLFIYRGLARWLSSTSVGLAVDAGPAFLDQIELLRNILVKGQYLFVPQVLVLLVVVNTLGSVHARHALRTLSLRDRRGRGGPLCGYSDGSLQNPGLCDLLDIGGTRQRAVYPRQSHSNADQRVVAGTVRDHGSGVGEEL